MDQRILIVEDEADLNELLEYTLTKEGFIVFCAKNASSALDAMANFKPDLVLLDLMLPDMYGLEICKVIKKEPKYKNIAVIILTARGMEADKVAGFDLGADDYVTKPFSTKELIMRIKAVLSRTARNVQSVVSAGDLTIDNQQHLVYRNQKKSYLTPTQFKILNVLLSHPGRVFSRNEILDRIWGQDIAVVDRAIDVQVKRLRDKLKLDLGVERLIRTVRGAGYKFDLD
ncbi:MAG: response regulator [candidate division Zixibacteria bacterium]|nr:response regulator [candidate division Zixibacteria bacterium]